MRTVIIYRVQQQQMFLLYRYYLSRFLSIEIGYTFYKMVQYVIKINLNSKKKTPV